MTDFYVRSSKWRHMEIEHSMHFIEQVERPHGFTSCDTGEEEVEKLSEIFPCLNRLFVTNDQVHILILLESNDSRRQSFA